MNAWTALPSLDAMSSESSSSPSSALLVGWHIASTLPRRLWEAYVAYLWYYQPDSWVGRVASTFRILAVILVLPVVLLTLLDVSSYVIARTLGVIDDVKASTSDADTTTHDGQPIAVAVTQSTTTTTCTSSTPSSLSHMAISKGPVRVPEDRASEDGKHRASEKGVGTSGGSSAMDEKTRGSADGVSDLSHACYFAGEEDLRLAGEGVFSPAVSMPPSPLAPRYPFNTLTEDDGHKEVLTHEEGIVLRRRVQAVRGDQGRP